MTAITSEFCTYRDILLTEHRVSVYTMLKQYIIIYRNSDRRPTSYHAYSTTYDYWYQ